MFQRLFRGYSDTMDKKSAEILDKLWIEFYMRGEQHEKENRKNALIDRDAVHPEPCGMCLWKDL